MVALNELDAELDKLAERFPGWRIWYVPCTTRSGGMEVKWCAQPLPLLNCHSPEDLAEAMAGAENGTHGGLPPE